MIPADDDGRPVDPTGRRALFSGATPDDDGLRKGRSGSGDGRQAVFSSPPRRPGTVVVGCSACGGRSPVPVLRLWRHLAPSAWVPGRRSFPVWMHCPACGTRGWCQLDWRNVVPSGGRHRSTLGSD